MIWTRNYFNLFYVLIKLFLPWILYGNFHNFMAYIQQVEHYYLVNWIVGLVLCLFGAELLLLGSKLMFIFIFLIFF